MKNENLKKNLFWILAGVAPFLTLLAFVFVVVSVGGAVSERDEAVKKELTELGGTKAKGTKGIATMEKQKEVIAQQKQKLWEANWNQQLKLFTWPNQPDLKVFEQKYTKFGEPLPNTNNEQSEFKREATYESVYNEMADSIKPTVFRGDSWRNVLRYVSAWGESKPTEPQIWLALEDMWVQRGLLEPIKAINEDVYAFSPVDDGKNLFKRKFRSKVWELELEIPREGKDANKHIKGKLTNLTNRMQVLGTGKTMKLKVWLTSNGQPIEYRIEEDMMRANSTLDIAVSDRLHGIPVGTEVKGIFKVQQQLDPRNVPVRRVDVVSLGKVDARHAAATLKAPAFWPADPVAVDPNAAAGGMGPLAGVGGEGGGGRGGPAGLGMPGIGGGAGLVANSGPPAAVLDGNKLRYIDVTNQVRRMPVGMVIIIDQAYLQDALAAFANSSLRFQVTQYHWKRFRDTLGGPAAGGGIGGGGEGEGPGGILMVPGGGGPPMGFGGGIRGGGVPGGIGSPPSAGFSGGPPMGFGGEGGPGFGMGGFGGLQNQPNVPEAQVTSGLVELSIYGIITLYEKYTDGTTPDPTKPADPATPKQ
ncbi:MAG: hypothetical protein ACRC8S_08080 [Fimbriiglobus sp.]